MAASVFVGAFIGVLPTLGVALALTWLATALCRLPKGPAMVASFVATPPTLFLFFYPLGYVAVGVPLLDPPAIDYDFLSVIAELRLSSLPQAGAQLWLSAKAHVVAFMAGMTVVALVTGVLCAAAVFVVMKRRAATPASGTGPRPLLPLRQGRAGSSHPGVAHPRTKN